MDTDSGSIDMPFGGDYTGMPSSTVNVEDSIASLFKEIGKTLETVTKQGVSSAVSTVKTALAEKIIGSPEGQAQVAAYKLQYVLKYLPWFAVAAVVLILAGKYIFRR